MMPVTRLSLGMLGPGELQLAQTYGAEMPQNSSENNQPRSSLASALANVRLRASEKPKIDMDNFAVTICRDSDDYNRMMEETYFEKYWESLKDFSFGSTFIPLDRDTANAIVEAHSTGLAIGLIKSQDNSQVLYPSNPSKQVTLDELVTTENTASEIADRLIDASPELSRLVDVLQATAESQGWHTDGVFVRLSSRSPKDAALCRPGFAHLFLDQLRLLQSQVPGDDDRAAAPASLAANARLLALHAASTAALRLAGGSVGRDAVRLLVQSGRIQDDLAQYAAGRTGAGFHAVLRQFRRFDPAHEFRGFVSGRRLTALTQYNDLVWFPALAAPARGAPPAAEGLARRVRAEFDRSIAPRLPPALGACVVDFVLCPAEPAAGGAETRVGEEAAAAQGAPAPAPPLQVRIIELNPFAEFAGSGLFDWMRDRAVLTGGAGPAGRAGPAGDAGPAEGPFEFRFVRECPPGQERVRLDGPWQRFLDLPAPGPYARPGPALPRGD